MKLELYAKDEIHAQAFRMFLNKNRLPFREINTTLENKNIASSYLKISKSHSISIIDGFNELILNQLVEHIKKYNPKIEI
jgi:hypothetical protein